MAVLARVALLLLPACYAPEIRDCTVICAAASDCADGQVCGTDQFCASPRVAGNCTSPDAGDPRSDAGTRDAALRDAAVPRDAAVDAPPPVDALVRAELHLITSGVGRITASGVGACDELGPTEGDCRFSVTIPRSIDLTATPHVGWRFEKWDEGPCPPAAATCTFDMTTATQAKAKFKRL